MNNMATNTNSRFDFIVVGGGPAGLTFAQRALQANKTVLVLESHSQIGGCHRVERVDGLFTEHGPRIYSSAYKSFKKILREIGLDFDDLFVPYHFQVSNIGGQSIKSLQFYELVAFTKAFLRLTLNGDYGNDVSVQRFADQNGFTVKTMDYLDRLCRLTDGAGIDRYTLNEFLNLVNEQSFYQLYQPKEPNDIGLFRLWERALLKMGMKLELNYTVYDISLVEDGRGDIAINGGEYSAPNVILAMPPQSLVTILRNASSDPLIRNNFGPFQNLKQFAQKSKYIEYIPITFHWNRIIPLPRIWGFPASEWGIAFVVLSDYMTFIESQSKTVISCAITYQDKMSSVLRKTAAQSSRMELITETFRQIREVFPSLPEPTVALVSPDVCFSGNQWINRNNAFIFSSTTLAPEGQFVKGLWTLGTHNMKSKYKFTSLESAVENAIDLSNKIVGGPYMEIEGPFTLIDFLWDSVWTTLLLVAIVFILYSIGWVYIQKKYMSLIITSFPTIEKRVR